jgi:hypothetical protein
MLIITNRVLSIAVVASSIIRHTLKYPTHACRTLSGRRTVYRATATYDIIIDHNHDV